MYPVTLDTVKNRQVSNARQQSQSDSGTGVYHILDIEIDDHGANMCRTGMCEHHPQEIRLFEYSEIPDFLKGNPWVVNGYRAFLPFGLCLKRFVL